MSSTASRIITNTGWLYAKMAITMFISLYTTRLILQGLGASDFGIYNIVGGAIGMLGFLNGSMSNATQRFMNYAEGEGDKEKKKKIFNVSYLLHLGIAALMIIIFIVAGFVFFNGLLTIPEGREVASYITYGCLIVSTANTIISVPYDALLISHENLRFYAIVGVIESLLKLSVAIICLYSPIDKLVIYGILMALIPISTRIIMRVYCHNRYEECIISFRTYYDHNIFKNISSFAGWNFLTSMSSLLSQYGLGIVLNHFFGTLLNAAQGIANQVSGVLMTLSSNAMKAINPLLVKSEGAKDRKKVFYIISVGSRINYMIFGFFSIPIIFYAEKILNLWLIDVPQWAVIFCQLQLLRILTEKLSGNLSSAIYAQGDIKNYTIVKGILNIAPIILVSTLFYFNYPPYVLYIVWILCWSILGGIAVVHFCNKLIELKYTWYIKNVITPCSVVSIIPLLVLILCNTYIRFKSSEIISVISFAITYLIVSWNCVLNKKEKNALIEFYTRKKSILFPNKYHL